MAKNPALLQFPPERRLEAYLRNLPKAFIHKCFAEVEPTNYIPNWHIDLFSEYFLAVQRKELKRLIINIPPGYTKTVATNIAFSAFCLGHDPGERIISSSHTYGLSARISNKVRRILSSEWYQRIFPETRLDPVLENTQDFFRTTAGGFRMVGTVGKAVTGDGGDLLLVDDPINAKDANANTATKLQECIDWFDGTLYSRLRDKKNGRIVIIMQRLHENDLTGHLLKSELDQYEHCVIPAIEETFGGKTYSFGKYSYFRPEGELLCDKIEGPEEIAKAKERLGSYGFAAQYQQEPAPKGGGMVKVEWFKRHDRLPDFEMIVQSWDTAQKAGELNDPSCCTTWGITENCYYLLDVFNERLEYPALKKKVLAHAEKWTPHALLIEDKSSGQSLIQELREDTTLPVIAIEPVGDKETRMSAQSAKIEAGKVSLPYKASWLDAYELELTRFPNSTHKDRVDSTSQFLGWVEARKVRASIRQL